MDKKMETSKVSQESQEELMHAMTPSSGKSLFSMKLLGLLLFVALLGVGTGFMLAGSTNTAGVAGKIGKIANSDVIVGKSYGEGDEAIFKDIAEGEMTEGGVEGEGQFHLVRPGGESQNVYLTSSSVDLSLFVERKVKVWGQTQKAQNVGWLMDVGKVEVLE